MTNTASRIIVIDDRPEALDQLTNSLRESLGTEAEVFPWRPESTEQDALQELDGIAGRETALVVTDYDLSLAQRGLFGSSIVAWCNDNYIPVCNFSRQSAERISSVAGLFEFRLSPVPELTAAEVARIYRGFRSVNEAARIYQEELSSVGSPARALSVMLGVPHAESEFTPYFSRIGVANGALVDRLQRVSSNDGKGSISKLELLNYIVGHVLYNSVLKYPGPILTAEMLAAYFGGTGQDGGRLTKPFAEARYTGPFSEDADLFWRSSVDDIIEQHANLVEVDDDTMPLDARNRLIAEALLGDQLSSHACDRCDGTRGGFWCPFTQRAVCERPDCSEGSSSWIPQGAWATRIERDFYDEWAPMLGY